MSSSDRNISTSKVEDKSTGNIIAQNVTTHKLSLRALDGYESSQRTLQEDLEEGPLLLGIAHNIPDGDMTVGMLDNMQIDSSDVATIMTSRQNIPSGEISMIRYSDRPSSLVETMTQSDLTSGPVFAPTEGNLSMQTAQIFGSIDHLTNLIADLRIGPSISYPERLDGIGLESRDSIGPKLLHCARMSRLEASLNDLDAIVLDDPSTRHSESINNIDIMAEKVANAEREETLLFPWNFEFAWTSGCLMFAGERLKSAGEAFQTSWGKLALSRGLSGSSAESSSSVFNSTAVRALSSTFSNHEGIKPRHGPIVTILPEQMEQFFVYLTDYYVRTYQPNAKKIQRSSAPSRQVNASSRCRKIAPAQPVSRPGPSRRRKLNNGSGDGSDDEGSDGIEAPTNHPVPNGQGRSFACPFVRRFPGHQARRYPDCILTIKTITALKGHLREIHRPDHCRTCLRVFDNADLLAAHMQHGQQGCIGHKGTWTLPQPWFITDAQWAPINKRFNRKKMLEQDQYQYIYHVLFPEDKSRPNPYMSDKEFAQMKELKGHWRMQGHKVLRKAWFDVMSTPFVMEESQIRSISKGWISRAMAEERYHLSGTGSELLGASYPDPLDHTESMSQLDVSLPGTYPQASLSNGNSADSSSWPVFDETEQTDELEMQLSTDLVEQLPGYDVEWNNPTDLAWDLPGDIYGLAVRNGEQLNDMSWCDKYPELFEPNEGVVRVPDMRVDNRLEVLENDTSFIANWPAAPGLGYEG